MFTEYLIQYLLNIRSNIARILQNLSYIHSDIAAMFETILAQYMFDAYIVAMFKIFFPPILSQHRPNTALKFNLILR